MKKVIYTLGLFILASTLSSKIYATTPPSDKHVFVSNDRDINFEVERKQGEIALYFQSTVFNQYDEIQVERSESDYGPYSVCKTIEITQIKPADGYYKTSDKYPLTAQKDCYYRIKTIAKDGTMKTFPPLTLAAIR